MEAGGRELEQKSQRARRTPLQALTADVARLKKAEKAVERKKKTVEISSTTMSQVATTVSVAEIAEGGDNDQRDGTKITVVQVAARFIVTWNNAQTPGIPTSFRISLLYDKRQDPGVNPPYANIYQGGSDADNNTIAFLNNDHIGRFQIIGSYSGYVSDQVQEVNIEFMLNQKNRPKRTFPMRWFSALGSAITQNGLYVTTVSDVASNGPVYSGLIRTTWTDA